MPQPSLKTYSTHPRTALREIHDRNRARIATELAVLQRREKLRQLGAPRKPETLTSRLQRLLGL